MIVAMFESPDGNVTCTQLLKKLHAKLLKKCTTLNSV
jgi:hypothetical protein